MIRKISTYLIILLCACAKSQAQNAPSISTLSDHMVLQREAPLCFSGYAAPGERIAVRLAGIAAEVRADQGGHWEVMLPPLPAGGPYDFQVGKQTYHDVWLGEVWLCSGQSNMEFRLNQDAEFRKNAKALSAPNGPAPNSEEGLRLRADDDRLHFFNMQARWRTSAYRWSEAACDSTDRLLYFDTSRGWERCTSQSASQFSAIAYYFGRELADSLGCHVGLVLNAVGGSPAESWIDTETLQAAQPEIYHNWHDNTLVQDWVRQRSEENVGRNHHRHPYQPNYLYDAGILPLKDMVFRGAIWYQGESNAQDIKEHELLFPLLLKSWRQTLKCPEGEFPFYMVQLSSIAPRLTWPNFRNSQRRLAREHRGVHMAISSDVGDSLDVHPRLKRPVGHRLAQLALRSTYGKATEQILPTEPTGYTMKKGCIYLDFGGMPVKFSARPRNMFEVRDAQGNWHEAYPTLDHGRLRLNFNPIITPTAVRYAWQPFTRACVTSASGWPLSTFEMELQ